MLPKLKVVFSIGAMHGGGSERQIVSLLHALDRTRFIPSLYLIYRAGPLLSEVPDDVPVTAFAERYPQNVTWIPGFMHRRRVADMRRFLVESQADVCYDRTFLMTLVSAAAAQRCGVPNISTIVTDPSLGFAPVAGRFQWFKKRILRQLYMRSTRVLANSEGAARSAEQFYGLPQKSVTTLYNGVDTRSIVSKANTRVYDPWWNAPESARRVFRMAAAGRLNQEKGFHLLIEAIQQLQQKHHEIDFRLAILGEGPGHRQLEEQIFRCSLQQSVRLMGFRTDAPAWYKSADLFVLSSFLEGMPNVLLEAMTCGTPILSTDCRSGPREILQDGTCGKLCEVGSAAALANGILSFVQDAELGKQYARAAEIRIRDCFSIETAAQGLEEFLTQAAHPTTKRITNSVD